MNQSDIRNFCIIAHIDHGKSTLADCLLEYTGAVANREMQAQHLDSMELEREKGVTIKASAVRMPWSDGERTWQLNLIDTPGHVDFSYEVTRALTACEGAVLVVDATQGIQAQTLAHLYTAIDLDLEIVPVINKIDLPSAWPDRVAEELESLLGVDADAIPRISAKNHVNIDSVLHAVIRDVPPPTGDPTGPLRSLVFDCHYDSYKGVIAHVRVVDGVLQARQPLRAVNTEVKVEPVEIGYLTPAPAPRSTLETGEVGYVATGLKSVRDLEVGETLTLGQAAAVESLPGYQAMKPMVFSGLYPVRAEDYDDLRDSLEKLQLNDAALSIQQEVSHALGFGFRVGYLGLFHMEIIQERLEREYEMDVIFTSPSVQYEVGLTDGTRLFIDSPVDMPEPTRIDYIAEPWCDVSIYTPSEFIGAVMNITTGRRAEVKSQEWLDTERVELTYRMPLSEIIVDFYNELKSATRGFASLDYQFDSYRPSDMVRMDILVNQQPVDAMSVIVHRDKAHPWGQKLVSKMKELIPRQMFQVPIQAALGNKVIARANVRALRKDVLAKCYGGDVTRKRKLLERQKEGKKRMKMVGQVEIPQEAFMSIFSLADD